MTNFGDIKGKEPPRLRLIRKTIAHDMTTPKYIPIDEHDDLVTEQSHCWESELVKQ